MLLILCESFVPDQGVGGSNPLAWPIKPTHHSSRQCSSFEQKSGPKDRTGLYDAEAGRAIRATYRNDEVGLSLRVLRSSSRPARSQRRYTGPEVSCRTHCAKP